eukprot:Unigene1413_Nuclearia_a/m.4478 Unigene1413_Nuclearia_a/g.4478  ORF Unigene1413_Nuclearia_a/g.4478 Unigene1413_Nuclearia_a/m.4478 type:complete len:200 (+) Unigene1413_Nuclearia_a:35-634(+)
MSSDAAQFKVKKIGGAKNGGERKVPAKRTPRFYPAEDVPKPVTRPAFQKPSKLRSSITPGTVLILLSGRFRGKRVVFLKQLSSGLLLVTGPFKINGVPLRRVNAAYVIATSTKVPLEGALDGKFDDKYFKRPAKKAATQEQLAEAAKQKKATIDPSRMADQKAADKAVLAAVKKVALLKSYLNATFTLTKGQYPHELKF